MWKVSRCSFSASLPSSSGRKWTRNSPLALSSGWIVTRWVQPLACEDRVHLGGIPRLRVFGHADFQTRIQFLRERRARVCDCLRDLMVADDMRIEPHLHKSARGVEVDLPHARELRDRGADGVRVRRAGEVRKVKNQRRRVWRRGIVVLCHLRRARPTGERTREKNECWNQGALHTEVLTDCPASSSCLAACVRSGAGRPS